MLMERDRIDADAAFRVLTRVGRARNQPLREIAHELVTTGQLRPGP